MKFVLHVYNIAYWFGVVKKFFFLRTISVLQRIVVYDFGLTAIWWKTLSTMKEKEINKFFFCYAEKGLGFAIGESNMKVVKLYSHFVSEVVGYVYNIPWQFWLVNGADNLCPDIFCPLRRRAITAGKKLCKQSLAHFLQAHRHVYTPSKTKNYVKNYWHTSCIL